VLCNVIGQPELKDDPRFVSNNGRVVNRPALRQVLDPAFRTRDAAEWLAKFAEAGLPCGPINTIPEVFAHPQAIAREMTLTAEHVSAGTVRFAGFPYKLSGTPAEVRLPPPALGQHTQQVLRELLGYSAEDIASLQERRIL
jgi:glutaryl-CoA transferase